MNRNYDSHLVTVEKAANGSIIRFHQPYLYLKEANVDRLRNAVQGFLSSLEPGPLILDLGNVDYLTAELLGLFVTLHRQVTERGDHLLLYNVCDPVYEILALTHISRIINIHRRWEPGSEVYRS